MSNKIGVAALAALLTLGTFAGSASAQCGTGPMIDWDANAFAYESSYNTTTLISSAGSQLTVVGIVNLFCSPLAFLDPSDPGKEYTFVMSGLTSAGTVHTAVPGFEAWATNYAGGTVAIYEGTPRNAPLAGAMPLNPPNATVPANFQDGTLILSGPLANFHTEITKIGTGTPVGNFTANYTFTGGSQAPLFVGAGQGFLQGVWCVSNCQVQQGYSAHPNGKFDTPPTAAGSPTWGAIKQLYR